MKTKKEPKVFCAYRLPAETDAMVKQMATARGISPAKLVEQAVNQLAVLDASHDLTPGSLTEPTLEQEVRAVEIKAAILTEALRAKRPEPTPDTPEAWKRVRTPLLRPGEK